jgi:hypothetical protein
MSSINLGPNFASVPAMTEQQRDFVQAQILAARSNAETAFNLATDAINKLATTVLPANLEDPPQAPTIDTKFSDSLSLELGNLPDFGSISQSIPPYNFVPDDISIPDVFGDLSALRAVIADMLATGTGLPPAIEAAIWERDVDRLTEDSVRDLDEAENTWAMKGFQLPPAALIAAGFAIQRDTAEKIAAQSRDVAVKQADLVQNNRHFAVDAGIKLAQAEADVALKLVDAFIARANLRLQYLLASLRYMIESADLQLKRVQVVATVFEAQLKRDVAAFDAQVKAIQLDVTARTEFARVDVALYQANIQAWTGRVTQVIEASRLLLTAMQATGQLAATIVAGAAAGTSLSAGVQASVNRGENSSQNQNVSQADSTATSWSNNISTIDQTIHNE